MLPVWLWACLALPSTVFAAVFQTAPGRFEIVAADAGAAQNVTALAEDAWRALAVPLALPEAFPSPVFVRVVPDGEWGERAPFRTLAEAGGVVTLRLSHGTAREPNLLRRAIVQALLLRLAVAQHGLRETLTVPLWLELGAAGWWETRRDPAQLDRLKFESGTLAPVRLGDLLGWQRGASEPREWSLSATWLFAHLQAETTGAGEWPAALRRLLAGDDAAAVIAAANPQRFRNEQERELWWRTGLHHLRRTRTLPALGAEQSRVELEACGRFVSGDDERDALVPLRVMLEHDGEAWVRAELQRRAVELNRLLPALHPFFRNAGLALLEALNARTSGAARKAEACAAFERDWRDALELQASTTAALDARDAAARGGARR